MNNSLDKKLAIKELFKKTHPDVLLQKNIGENIENIVTEQSQLISSVFDVFKDTGDFGIDKNTFSGKEITLIKLSDDGKNYIQEQKEIDEMNFYNFMKDLFLFHGINFDENIFLNSFNGNIKKSFDNKKEDLSVNLNNKILELQNKFGFEINFSKDIIDNNQIDLFRNLEIFDNIIMYTLKKQGYDKNFFRKIEKILFINGKTKFTKKGILYIDINSFSHDSDNIYYAVKKPFINWIFNILKKNT